jgi:hypothetical protein
MLYAGDSGPGSGPDGDLQLFNSQLTRSVGPDISGTINQLDNISLTEVSGFKELATPWYSDQILPFDITGKRNGCRD